MQHDEMSQIYEINHKFLKQTYNIVTRNEDSVV